MHEKAYCGAGAVATNLHLTNSYIIHEAPLDNALIETVKQRDGLRNNVIKVTIPPAPGRWELT